MKKIQKILCTSISLLILGIVWGILTTQYETWYKLYSRYELEGVILSLTFFPAALVMISFILLFLREQVFHSWLRFTKWYLPIAAILILISSDGGSLFIGFGGGYDREGMIWFTSGLFLIISLLIIGIKSWKLRGSGN